MELCCGGKLRDLRYRYMASRLRVSESLERDEQMETKLSMSMNIKSLEQVLTDIQKLKRTEEMKRYSTFDRRISFLKRSSIINKTNYKSGRTILEKRLLAVDCELIKVPGDGNCLFRSISCNLFNEQKYHMYVRKRCVEHMLNCKEEFSIYFEEGTFHEYTEKMSQNGYWGDELCIKATADAFDCVVYIITSTEDNWHLKYESKHRTEGEYKKCVFLAYTSPVHYDSFRLIRS
ncbi:OTU-like cysteine protease [Plasmodium coatneyi]|uniref:OTU-like cysteine protease n=1 Tax=Plasmodium coatneyi TaxID=208452 RepID=A0A1B1DY73_9APIC|nr:OTU-like cysteine protease [Plasmodium coatneyi]ANQ07547.1 OTU-like cysteine protease [Plasmodium coatneyi]